MDLARHGYSDPVVILATKHQFTVGDIASEVEMTSGRIVQQPVRIVRVASYAEWVAYAKIAAPMLTEAALLHTHHEYPHFYEVTTD